MHPGHSVFQATKVFSRMLLKVFPILFVVFQLFSIGTGLTSDPPADFSKNQAKAEDITFSYYKSSDEKPEYATGNQDLKIDDKKKALFTIVPDNTADNSTEWVVTLRTELLKQSKQVLVVDWSKAGGEPEISKNNVKFIGVTLAKLLKGTKLDSSAIYVIGFGFGAQIAGQAGKEYQQKAGKPLQYIYALDPAASGFEVGKREKKKIPPSNRLDADDAKFVTCYHTDCEKTGVKAANCLVDFYVNGGNAQPGCTDDVCDHERAIQIFISSLTHIKTIAKEATVQIIGKKVSVTEKSSGKKSLIGLATSPDTKGIFTFETTEEPPYVE